MQHTNSSRIGGLFLSFLSLLLLTPSHATTITWEDRGGEAIRLGAVTATASTPSGTYYSVTIGSGLRKVVLPPSVESVGGEAFSYNSQLTYVDFSSTKIKELNAGLFYECGKLTNILLPKGMETIGQDCFAGTKHLTTVDLPKSLKIMCAPFDGSAITTLHIPDSVIWIYDPLSSKTKDVYLNWRGGSVYNDVYIMGYNGYNYTKESEYRYFDMVYLVPNLYVPEENDWKFWKEKYKMDIRTNGRLYLK